MRLRNLLPLLLVAGCAEKHVVDPKPPGETPIAEARALVRRALADSFCLDCELKSVRMAPSGAKIATKRTGVVAPGASVVVRVPFDAPLTEFSCGGRNCRAWVASSVVEAHGIDPRGLYERWPLMAANEVEMGRLANAYNTLVAWNRDPSRGEAEFAADADAWRTNPRLSEAGDRHRVLAENAFREKNVDGAIEHFEAALETDPAWPDGNFNLALLYGDTGEYALAARHMKRYLLVVPDSKDAKSAREKIIVWEDKAEHASP